MADDGKRTEVICTKVTEQMALDLLRSASARNRSVSDAIYIAMRHWLYGNIARLDKDAQFTASHKVDRHGDDE